MAETDMKKCLTWMVDQQEHMESEKFKHSKGGVADGVNHQKDLNRVIGDRQKEIDGLIQKYKLDQIEAKKISMSYSSLKAVSDKRTSCYDIISQVADLEDSVQELTVGFDARAVHLVNIAENNSKAANKTQSNESLAKTAQKCIAGVRTNWAWIRKLMSCADIHLKNAGNYHQFFHEVDEAEYFMNSTLAKIHLTFNPETLKGDAVDVRNILGEMKDVLLAYLTWQTKIDTLFDRAKDVVPVPARLQKLQEPRPCVCLADYKTDDIEMIEHETVTLLNSDNKKSWQVKNESGQKSNVPSVLLLIPGPAGAALDAAIRLRIQLLSLWTASIKRLGFQLIAFMLMIIRDWNEEEVKLLQNMPEEERTELLRILKFIEETLMPNWKEYPDFEELQERITRTRMILEEAPENGGTKTPEAEAMVVQMKLLEEMLLRYKDFSDYWETYKVVVESMREPKFLLVADPKDNMKFVSTAHMSRFWDTSLDVQNMDSIEQLECVKAESASCFETPKTPLDEYASDVTISTEKEEVEQDEVRSSLQEETQTIRIKMVEDPRDGNVLDLQHAVMLGVIDQTNGTYVNPDTGETMTIKEGMNLGKIMVDIINRRKVKDEKQSFGLITIKTTKETRPYTIKGAKDPKTKRMLSVSEACETGILDTHNQLYKTESGAIPIADAIGGGYVDVEYGQSDKAHKPETVTRTYAVNSVVDQRRQKKIPFPDAVARGLLDKDTGMYVNNVTREKLSVSSAIMKGFIKARVVADPSKLDIDPENRIVIEKFTHAKNKLLGAMRAMKRMKDMAETNGNK